MTRNNLKRYALVYYKDLVRGKKNYYTSYISQGVVEINGDSKMVKRIYTSRDNYDVINKRLSSLCILIYFDKLPPKTWKVWKHCFVFERETHVCIDNVVYEPHAKNVLTLSRIPN